jgi:hypothetical protein
MRRESEVGDVIYGFFVYISRVCDHSATSRGNS